MSATFALLMTAAMVLVTLFMIILEQITDLRRNKEFELELSAWRVRLWSRYGRRGEKVGSRRGVM